VKRCAHCKIEKTFEEFPKSRSERDGYFGYCKPCHSEKRKAYRRTEPTPEQRAEQNAKRRAFDKANPELKRQRRQRYYAENYDKIREKQRLHEATKRAAKHRAMPAWADREHIRRFYAEAEIMTRLTGISHHVDHIIPLRGRGVCGLHVPANLRVVTREFNLKKGNKLTLL